MEGRESDEIDRADMARLAAGSGAALDALMERHAGAVFGFLCRFVGDEDAANDLAQETFVRVYRHARDFKPRLRFSNWLFTIAGNLARNHLRSRSRHPEVSIDSTGTDGARSLADSLPATGGTPADDAQSAECHAAVRRAVAGLPDDLREATILCELEDRTVAEAAEILDATAKAVESRLYRARRHLRDHLASWFPDR